MKLIGRLSMAWMYLRLGVGLLFSAPIYGLLRLVARWKVMTRAVCEAKPIAEIEVEPEDLHGVIAQAEPLILKGFLQQFEFSELLRPEPMRKVWGDRETLTLASRGGQTGFLQESAPPVKVRFRDLIDLCFHKPPSKVRLYSRAGGNPAVLRELRNRCDSARDFDHYGIWVGQEGNTTPFHSDHWHSFLGQTVGRKLVVMVPPKDSLMLEQAPLLSRSYNASGPTRLPDDVRIASDPSHPEEEAHNRGFLRAERYEVIMAPGDFLYIPPRWWHTVVSLDPCVSVLLRYSLDEDEYLSKDQLRYAFTDRWSSLLTALGVSVSPAMAVRWSEIWAQRDLELLRESREREHQDC